MNNEVSIINRDLNATIEAFEKLKAVAEYLASSEAFVKDLLLSRPPEILANLKRARHVPMPSMTRSESRDQYLDIICFS